MVTETVNFFFFYNIWLFFGCRLLQHVIPDLQVMVKIAHESAHISVIALSSNSCY